MYSVKLEHLTGNMYSKSHDTNNIFIYNYFDLISPINIMHRKHEPNQATVDCSHNLIYVTGNMWNQGFHVIPGHFRDFMKLLNCFREFVKSLTFSGFSWNPWKVTPQQEYWIRKNVAIEHSVDYYHHKLHHK